MGLRGADHMAKKQYEYLEGENGNRYIFTDVRLWINKKGEISLDDSLKRTGSGELWGNITKGSALYNQLKALFDEQEADQTK